MSAHSPAVRTGWPYTAAPRHELHVDQVQSPREERLCVNADRTARCARSGICPVLHLSSALERSDRGDQAHLNTGHAVLRPECKPFCERRLTIHIPACECGWKHRALGAYLMTVVSLTDALAASRQRLLTAFCGVYPSAARSSLLRPISDSPGAVKKSQL